MKRLSRGLDYGPMKVGKAKRTTQIGGIYGKRVSGSPRRDTVRVRRGGK